MDRSEEPTIDDILTNVGMTTIPACGEDSERSKGRCATKLPRIADGDTYKSHDAKSVVGRSVGVFCTNGAYREGHVAT